MATYHPFDIAQRGFDKWKAKEHNKKWFRLIDGTPIPNDLVVCIAMEFMMKDVPEYDEGVQCENPECKHVEAEVITGLYGIAGGGGIGPYTVCEHCGVILTKSVDESLNHTFAELKDERTPDTKADEPTVSSDPAAPKPE
jgi:hypothetical protein